MKVVRYAVRMKNGSFMVQRTHHENAQIIDIHTVDNPIDADLLYTKETAQRCIDEILDGSTNLMVLYDDNNPPMDVVELNINCQIN